MYNNYFNHVNSDKLGIDLNALRKEHNNFEFNVLRFDESQEFDEWFNKQDTWWVAAVDDLSSSPEIKKIILHLEQTLSIKFLENDILTDKIGVRFYIQKKGAELLEHEDYPESHVALNFTFDENVAPISFSDIGDIYYKCCLFNVSNSHYVKASPIDRLMLRITPMNVNYQEVCDKFDAAGLFLNS